MGHGTPDYYSPMTALTDLLLKLDDIDGAVDGVISLSDLNSGQCEMLGKLAGIDTSLLTDGDLINKLDALDGTMDGKLSLSQLNASAVKTNLDANVVRLETVITRLDTEVTKLIGIATYAAHGQKADSQYSITKSVVSTQATRILEARATRVDGIITNTHESVSLYIGFATNIGSDRYVEILAPSKQYTIVNYAGEIHARAVSDTGTACGWETYYT